MANRVTVPTTNFESLSPPWSLNSLDNDFLALQSALNDASLGYITTGTDTGTANHYNIATPAFGMPSAYQAGMTVAFLPANTNTGPACTLAVGGLSVQPLQVAGGGIPPAGWIALNQPCLATYIGTAFIVLSTGAVPLSVYNNAPGATMNVSCLYASTVTIIVVWSSPITTFLTLNNLVSGTPVSITFVNNSGGACIYRVLANDPFANSITTSMTFPTSAAGAAPVPLSTSQTLGAGNVLTLLGMSTSALLYFNT